MLFFETQCSIYNVPKYLLTDVNKMKEEQLAF